MNKKGFTLIEVIVSIVLVSVVLVSLMATLIKLRETYSVIHENSDVLVYASSISRVINNDIMDNNGIRYASCDMNGVTCDITLGNDQKRRLEIIEEEINHGRIKRTDKKEANHVTKNSTLKYSDTTKEEKAEDGTIDTSKNKIIYIRTLALEDYTEIIKENGREIEGVHTTEGYNFYSITSDTSEIKKIKNNEIFVDVVTKLIVNIYDGIDVNDTKYNVTLYSAGKYNESEYIGKRYTIEFDLNGAETSSGDYSMDEVFGVGYYKTGEKAVLKNKITKIKIPKRSDQAFLGYYYSNGEVQVVDGIGNIVASNMLFKNDVLLGPEAKERVYAKWGPCEAPGYKVVEGGCSPNEFTMTLNANGGKFEDGNNINVYTKVLYQSKLPNLRAKPQRAGYGFEGFSYNGKKYYDNTGNQVSIYDIDHNETLNAGWHICAERTYSTAEMLSCEPCPLTYTSGAGAKNKSECYLDVGPGKELPNINTDYIKSCDPGHYNNTNERVYFGKNKTCSQCAAGYYQPNSGATTCIKCAAGYNSGKGAKECYSRIYTITLNNNGATSAGTKTIYMKYNTGWYKDAGATTSMSKITPPSKTGYTFEGYYTSASGGTQIINASGNILSGKTTIFNDTSNKGTLFAHWKINCNIAVNTIIENVDMNGLVKDEHNEYRYQGIYPNNYVSFNGEVWRIIGVFDTKNALNGTSEKRIKIVRRDAIGSYSWDSTPYDIAYGMGINQWGESGDYEGADIMRELNGDYLDSTLKNDTFWSISYGETKGSFNHNTVLTKSSQKLIDDALWYLGAFNGSSASEVYNYERSEFTCETEGKIGCETSSYYDNTIYYDKIKRTTKWVGKVALPYYSDFLYSNGWLTIGWTLNPRYNNASFNTVVYNNSNTPLACVVSTYCPQRVHPTLYLKSNIELIDGDGTISNPYLFKSCD